MVIFMDKILFYQNVCHSLAKATGSGVRLFINDVCVYYYSIFHIHPGPAIPFLPELLSKKNIAGVITTPLYQFYGYLTTDEGYRIIIGPSRIEKNDGRLINEQLFILGVPSDVKNNYVHLLECCPKVSA